MACPPESPASSQQHIRSRRQHATHPPLDSFGRCDPERNVMDAALESDLTEQVLPECIWSAMAHHQHGPDAMLPVEHAKPRTEVPPGLMVATRKVARAVVDHLGTPEYMPADVLTEDQAQRPERQSVIDQTQVAWASLGGDAAWGTRGRKRGSYFRIHSSTAGWRSGLSRARPSSRRFRGGTAVR